MDSTKSLKTLLEKFDTETIENFLHELFDYWLHRGKLKYNKYVKLLSIEDWWFFMEEFEKLSKLFLNLTQEKFDAHLHETFDAANKQIIQSVLNVRKNDLIEYFKDKTFNLTDNFLYDFNWSVKLCMSSDKLAKLNENICALNMYYGDQKQETRKSISFELNKSELDQFISTLESIDQVMDEYK